MKAREYETYLLRSSFPFHLEAFLASDAPTLVSSAILLLTVVTAITLSDRLSTSPSVFLKHFWLMVTHRLRPLIFGISTSPSSNGIMSTRNLNNASSCSSCRYSSSLKLDSFSAYFLLIVVSDLVSAFRAEMSRIGRGWRAGMTVTDKSTEREPRAYCKHVVHQQFQRSDLVIVHRLREV